MIAAAVNEWSLLLEDVLRRESGETLPLTIHLWREGEEWRPAIWGYAAAPGADPYPEKEYNRADHPGRLVSAVSTDEGGWRLELAVDVQRDAYRVGGGAGRYTVTLPAWKDGAAGTVEGTFDDAPVAGEVRLRRVDPALALPTAVTAVPHPRLILTGPELDVARTFIATPTGRAWMERFDALLDQPVRNDGRNPGWMAAGWALKYRLTGDETAWTQALAVSTAARAIDDPEQTILRWGPRWLGLALAYDLLRDPLEERDPVARAAFADDLRDGLARIVRGGGPGYNDRAWSNWMGIRYGSMGVVALALAGERGSDGEVITTLPYLQQALVGSRRFHASALGVGGFPYEGQGYLRFTWCVGQGPFLHALVRAQGLDLGAAYGIRWMLPALTFLAHGDFITTWGPGGWGGFAMSDHRAAGFAMGLGLVPKKWVPAAQTLFQQHYGAEGAGTWNASMPHHIGYLLANPDLFAAKPAEAVFPRAWVDRTFGFYGSRVHPGPGPSPAALVYAQSQTLSAVHRAARDIDIWLLGPTGRGPRWREVRWPERSAVHRGAEVIWARRDAVHGSLNVSLDLTAGTRRQAGASEGEPGSAWRGVAADFSGASGVATVFALAEVLPPAAGRGLQLELGREAQDLVITGRRAEWEAHDTTWTAWVFAPDEEAREGLLQGAGDVLQVEAAHPLFLFVTARPAGEAALEGEPVQVGGRQWQWGEQAWRWEDRRWQWSQHEPVDPFPETQPLAP